MIEMLSSVCPDRAVGGQQVHRPAVRFAVILWGEPNDKCRSLLDCPVLSYAEVLAQGHRASNQFESAPLSSDQLATIVYTSGTTGNPKVPSLLRTVMSSYTSYHGTFWICSLLL